MEPCHRGNFIGRYWRFETWPNDKDGKRLNFAPSHGAGKKGLRM